MSNNNWNQQKPPLGSVIDWSNPLSRGLVRAYIPRIRKISPAGSLVDIDLVSNAQLKTFTGQNTEEVAVRRYGYEIIQPATGEVASFGMRDFSYNINYNTGVSIAVLFKINTPNGFLEGVFGGAFSGGGLVTSYNSPVAMAFYKSGAGIAFAVNGDSLALGAMTSTTVTTNTYYAFVGTYQKTGAATYGGIWKTYLNGERNGTDNNYHLTGSFNGNFGANHNCCIGTSLSNKSSDMSIVYTYIWNRTLSPSEIKSLYIAPYQIIYKPSNRFYFTPAAGGGNYKMKSMTIIES